MTGPHLHAPNYHENCPYPSNIRQSTRYVVNPNNLFLTAYAEGRLMSCWLRGTLLSCLLLLCGILRRASAREVSVKPCEELRDRVGNWRTFGSPNVCGSSKVSPDGPVCPAPLLYTWMEAQAMCRDIGMRLCTPQELLDDEPKQTGCMMDTKRVWTSELCGVDTKAFSQAGASDYIDAHPKKCSNFDAKLGVRCCADTKTAGPPLVCKENEDPCRSKIDDSNECIVLSDTSYKCVCRSPMYTEDSSGKMCVTRICAKNCKIQELPGNGCIDFDDGSYQCECTSPFVRASDGLSCISESEEQLACSNNECSSRQNPGNVCVRLDKYNYYCSCRERGWKGSPDGQSCLRVESSSSRLPAPSGLSSDPKCLDNECSSAENPLNICVDNVDGTYQCECRANGFKNTPDRQSCFRNACWNDECSSGLDRGNVCRPFIDGSYQCVCGGLNFLPSADFRSCIRAADTCTHDECSTVSNSSNVCVGNPDGSYYCECNGRYFANSQDRLSCVRVQPACTKDRCSSSLNANNVCVDREDGTYYCDCFLGFSPTEDYQGCEKSAPCENNECAHLNPRNGNRCVARGESYSCLCNKEFFRFIDSPRATCAPKSCLRNECNSEVEGNVCIDHGTGSFHCECNGKGWVNSASGRSCYQWEPKCRQDECSSSLDAANVCIPDDRGGYRCECKGKRFAARLDGKSCLQYAPQCLGNECGVIENPGNRCIDNFDGTFSCECDPYSHTAASTDGLECLPVEKRCLTNECSSAGNPGNKCIDNFDGTHTCVCDHPSFVTGNGGRACVRRPCISNECSQLESPDNRCLEEDNFAGYTCECGVGFRAYKQRTQCVPIRCQPEYNECSIAENPTNACIDNFDGTYHCKCYNFWYTSSDLQKCIRRRCQENECSHLDDYRNYCHDNLDSSYRCSCYDGLWATGPNAQACIKKVCLDSTNECNQNDGNICIDKGDGTYLCKCDAPGYKLLEDANGQSCRPPFDPCNYNPCRSDESEGANTCLFNSATSKYSCECDESKGWLLGKDYDEKDICVPRESACRHNPCSSRQDRANICIDNRDGTHRCKCGGKRWSNTPDQTRCQYFRNYCLQDPCDTKADPSNICTDHQNGTYSCTCDGRRWKNTDDRQRCVMIRDKCLDDPCSREQDPRNRCIDYLNGKCSEVPRFDPSHGPCMICFADLPNIQHRDLLVQV